MRGTKQPEIFRKHVEPFLARDEFGAPCRDENKELIVEPPDSISHLINWAEDLFKTKDACGIINPDTLSVGELHLLCGITQGYARGGVAKQNEPRVDPI